MDCRGVKFSLRGTTLIYAFFQCAFIGPVSGPSGMGWTCLPTHAPGPCSSALRRRFPPSAALFGRALRNTLPFPASTVYHTIFPKKCQGGIVGTGKDCGRMLLSQKHPPAPSRKPAGNIWCIVLIYDFLPDNYGTQASLATSINAVSDTSKTIPSFKLTNVESLLLT